MSANVKESAKKSSTSSVSSKKNHKRKNSSVKGNSKVEKIQHNQTNNYHFSENNFSSNWKSFLLTSSSLQNNKPNGKSIKITKPFENRKLVYNAKAHNWKSITVKQDNKPTLLDKPKRITNVVAIDCEMVGIDTGKVNMLARVSLVNMNCECIYDKYVLPREQVVDYRTHITGIRPKDLENGEEFEIVQKEVAEILRGKILVGHAIKNDLKVMYLNHPKNFIRDTSKFKMFRELTNGVTPSLQKLADEILGVKIQQKEHDSVTDAKAAMQLYVLYRKEWEKSFKIKIHRKLKKVAKHKA